MELQNTTLLGEPSGGTILNLASGAAANMGLLGGAQEYRGLNIGLVTSAVLDRFEGTPSLKLLHGFFSIEAAIIAAVTASTPPRLDYRCAIVKTFQSASGVSAAIDLFDMDGAAAGASGRSRTDDVRILWMRHGVISVIESPLNAFSLPQLDLANVIAVPQSSLGQSDTRANEKEFFVRPKIRFTGQERLNLVFQIGPVDDAGPVLQLLVRGFARGLFAH